MVLGLGGLLLCLLDGMKSRAFGPQNSSAFGLGVFMTFGRFSATLKYGTKTSRAFGPRLRRAFGPQNFSAFGLGVF